MKSAILTSKEKSYIISGPNLPVLNSRSLGREIFCSMLLNGSSIAQIDPETGESVSYSDLLLKCIRTSLHLLSKGITKDDIICQCTWNHCNTCIPVISGLFLGCKFVCFDPSRSFIEMKHLVNQIQTKIIFASPDVVEIIEKSLSELCIQREIVVFGESKKHTQFDSFLTPIEKENDFQPIDNYDIDEIVMVLFRYRYGILHPDRISLSANVLKLQILNFVSCWNLGKRLYMCNYGKERRDNGFMVVMGFCTYCWISAITFMLSSVMTGITRIISSEFHVEDVWKNIDKYQISFMLCNTFQANELHKNPQPEQSDGKTLRMLVVNGTSLSRTSLINLRQLFPICFITTIYEHPEIAGAISLYNFTKPNDIKDQYEKPTSYGRLLPGIICKIIDPKNKKILKLNEPGEIRFKVKFINNENLNFFKFDKDGFIRTNLLGFYDNDNCLHILDFYKDIIKYKCKTIIPSILENIIKDHPAVKEAIVIGIPNENKNIGEHAEAIVSLKKHMTNRVTEEDLQLFTNSFLKTKLLQNVKIVKKIQPNDCGIFSRTEIKQNLL